MGRLQKWVEYDLHLQCLKATILQTAALLIPLIYPDILLFLFCVEKDEPTRLRRDGLEPSTLAYEASKLPLLYPAVSDRRLELHSLN